MGVDDIIFGVGGQVQGPRNSNIGLLSPLDVMYRANPELASLAYANKEKLLTPEMMPLFRDFRNMQKEEKIATLGAIVQKLGIDADRDKHFRTMKAMEDIVYERQKGMTERTNISETNATKRTDLREKGLNYRTDSTQKGMTDRTRISEEGATKRKMFTELGATKRVQYEQSGKTKRTRLQEDGMNYRAKVAAQSAHDLMKMKYAVMYEIRESELKTERYLSDNNLRALEIEMKAMVPLIKDMERMRSNTAKHISNNETLAKIKEHEYSYLESVVEAECVRDQHMATEKRKALEAHLNYKAQVSRNAYLGMAARVMSETRKHEAAWQAASAFVSSLERMYDGEDKQLTVQTPFGPMTATVVNLSDET